MHKAVFLDRDGVICQDVHYMARPEQFVLLPGVGEGIMELNKMGFLVIVASNQSGIARGYFTEEDLKAVTDRMVQELAKHDARLDGIYYCPCLQDCECRKPNPWMLVKAATEHDIELKGSFMVGDQDIDVEAGRAAGCTTIIIGRGDADYSVSNFSEAVKIIRSYKEGKLEVREA